MSQILINEAGIVIPNPGGQAGFANDWTHTIVGLEGGWMSGKTFIGSRKLVTLHIHNAFDLETGQPTYIPSAAVSPTYSNAMDFQVPALTDAFKEAGLSYKWKSTGSVSQGKFSGPALILPDLGTNKNPSVILIRTAERPETITGWQVGAGWGDEPARWKEDMFDPKNDAYTQFIGRVRHPDANFVQKMFTYTNEGDATKIYKEMHSDNASLYRAPTNENPRAAVFYDEMKKNLTADLAEQYLEGGAASLRGGRVYPSFAKKHHVSNRLKLNKNLPLHLSIDFNIAPGMHFEIGQLHNEYEDNWLFTTVHEIFTPRLSVKDAVIMFGRLIEELGGWQWPMLYVFGDASGNAQWSGTGESNIAILEDGLLKLGIPYELRIPRSNPMVVDRINAVELTLKDCDSKVHWKCHGRCQRLIEDRMYLKRDSFGGIDKSQKKLSHASDADDYRIEFLRPVRVTRREDLVGQFSVVA